MRSKSSLLVKHKTFQINYDFRYLQPSFISHFHFLPYKNKLISLIRFANGGLTYFLTLEGHDLFSFFYVCKVNKYKTIGTRMFYNLLFRLNILSRVSLIEMIPGRGAQYCRSSGALGRLLKFDKKTSAALIRLPSGAAKLFSRYSCAALDRVVFKENIKFFNSKAGY